MDAAAPKSRSSRGSIVKVISTVVVIGGAIALLMSASISKGSEYYKFVDEVTASPDAFRNKKLQVHGQVVDGSIEQAKGTLMYRFKIESAAKANRPPAVIAATYEGLVPDTFKGGAEVIVRGSLTPDNQVAIIPDGIMAKCPSKYEQDQAAAAKTGGVTQKL